MKYLKPASNTPEWSLWSVGVNDIDAASVEEKRNDRTSNSAAKNLNCKPSELLGRRRFLWSQFAVCNTNGRSLSNIMHMNPMKKRGEKEF